MNARIDVGERRDRQPLEQFLDLRRGGQQHRDDDHGSRVRWKPVLELQAQQPPGSDQHRDETLNEDNRHFAVRHEEQQPDPELVARDSALPAHVGQAKTDQESRDEADGPGIARCRGAEHQPPEALRDARPVADVRLEVRAALADQVVADMCGAVGHRTSFCSLAGAFNRAQRHADLRLAGRRHQLLDGLALAITAQEVHRAVHAGRIALKHLFHAADRLEVVAPVERRAETQACQNIGHRHLGGCLSLMFRPDRVFRCHPAVAQVSLDRGVQRREAEPVLAHSLQQSDHVRHVSGRRQRAGLDALFILSHGDIRRHPRLPRDQNLFRQPAEVLDEGQPEHARPAPELADRQRGHRLVTAHEPDELRSVQTAVAVPDELERHRVGARMSVPLRRREPRQLAIIGMRKVLADGADLGCHEMKMVQQPLGRGCDELPPMNVVGRRGVSLPQHPGVVAETGKWPLGSSGCGRHR